MPSDHGFMKCLKAIFFFLGYFEYFKPGLVQCLNKLWHWAILTLLSNHRLHIDVPCVQQGGFPLNTPWPESSTRGQKVPFFRGGGQCSCGVVGTRTEKRGMKYVEDLNKTLVNWRSKGVKNTTQRAAVKCSANSNLRYCRTVRWDELWININCWPLQRAEDEIQ